MFNERGADVIVAAFHPGKAGLPTMQHTYAPISDCKINFFHTADLWVRRLDDEPLPAQQASPAAIHIALPAGAAHLTPASGEASLPPLSLPSVTAFTEALSSHYQVAFGPEASFRTRYLHPDTSLAGTFWYDFDHGKGAHCCISFEMANLLYNTHQIGLAGNIQTVYAHLCTPLHLQQALHHLCHYLQRQGCVVVSMLDHRAIPSAVLHALNFRPTGGSRLFSVRGSEAVMQRFETIHPPYVLDW